MYVVIMFICWPLARYPDLCLGLKPLKVPFIGLIYPSIV